MRSVTPIETGIKRYKIHPGHFLIPIEFHIQFGIAFQVNDIWSVYSEHWTIEQVIIAATLPRSRLKQIVSYCIFLLGFVIWCVKRNIIQNVPCAAITHWPYITGQRKSYYPVTKIMFLDHYQGRIIWTLIKGGILLNNSAIPHSNWGHGAYITSILKIYGKIPLD